ncbi:hypothetical protein EV368DRAFT_65556 [Lentinula lateritia]|nr:hypothetical protein EV368DRAFT_65556 [Lentinula lateritia]
MSSNPARCSTSYAPAPFLPTLTSLGEVVSLDPESNGEVEQDQLAFTIGFPSRPQLQLFKTIFNTGKPLSGYCQEVLAACTSSSSTLLELNMLNEQDAVNADQQELQKLLALQQDEAAIAAKCQLLVASATASGPPPAFPSPMEVPVRDKPVGDCILELSLVFWLAVVSVTAGTNGSMGASGSTGVEVVGVLIRPTLCQRPITIKRESSCPMTKRSRWGTRIYLLLFIYYFSNGTRVRNQYIRVIDELYGSIWKQMEVLG